MGLTWKMSTSEREKDTSVEKMSFATVLSLLHLYAFMGFDLNGIEKPQLDVHAWSLIPGLMEHIGVELWQLVRFGGFGLSHNN